MNSGVKTTVAEALERDEIPATVHLDNLARIAAGLCANANLDATSRVIATTAAAVYEQIIDTILE